MVVWGKNPHVGGGFTILKGYLSFIDVDISRDLSLSTDIQQRFCVSSNSNGCCVSLSSYKEIHRGTRIMSVWSFLIKTTVSKSEKTHGNKKLWISTTKQNP